MQLTLWFWPRILGFVARHTCVARRILSLRCDGQLNARLTPCEIVPGCRAPHSQLMQKRCIRSNFAQAKSAPGRHIGRLGQPPLGEAGRGKYARHHHCARAASVAGGSAGFWTVGEPAAARARVVSKAHAARPSDHLVLWRSGRLLGRQLRSGWGSLRGHHHRRAPGRTARPPAPESGERIVVPNHKIKWDDGNPTGHGIIFIGMGGQVYCYVPPGGV